MSTFGGELPWGLPAQSSIEFGCKDEAEWAFADADSSPATLADVVGSLDAHGAEWLDHADAHLPLAIAQSSESAAIFDHVVSSPAITTAGKAKGTSKLIQILDPALKTSAPKWRAEASPMASGTPDSQSIAGEVPEVEDSKLADSESATISRVPFMEHPPMLTRELRALRADLEQTLRFYNDKPLNAEEDSPWSVMHSMLGYGPQGTLLTAATRGKRVSVVNWLCQNQPCAGNRLLFVNEQRLIRGRSGAGFEGHPGQFLAMLAQTGIPASQPLWVGGQAYRVADLVKAEQLTCQPDIELTFKLLSLAIYLEPDATWIDQGGATWDLQRLLAVEISEPVNGVACGGTHRLMACSVAVRQRMLQELPLDGVYARAAQYVRDYQRYTLSLQNQDGSMSSDWFRKRASWGDLDRQLQTTGHMLEWLVYSLPQQELADPRIVKSVTFLTDLMTRNRHHAWEVGPRGHALRALNLYLQRVFTPEQGVVARQTEVRDALNGVGPQAVRTPHSGQSVVGGTNRSRSSKSGSRR